MKITFISDTHTKHDKITEDLPGGDLIIHAGDFMNSGRSRYEQESFFKWYSRLDNYKYKILIAGNHDWLMQTNPKGASDLLKDYNEITYLQDSYTTLPNCKIYGSPWQPEFCNWAFNLPRNGKELAYVWGKVPEDTDILVTHGPPHGILDVPGGSHLHVGDELLNTTLRKIKPKIHVFGHVHGSAGYVFQDGTHYINASVLNEQYMYMNQPMVIDWNPITNEIKWL